MMTLIAGSYERFIWGFSLRPSSPETLTLTPLFSYPSHSGPIKSAAALFPLAATGSSDDSIRLYDLSLSSELSSLLDHSAPVLSLSFFASPLSPSLPRNLISADADGNVAIYDVGDGSFVHLKTVPVHRKAVADVAVHPSGRVALTVGRDKGIGMVNLVRGRRSFLGKLDREAEIVRYGESGERFFMVREERVSIHDSEDARVVVEMDAGKRVLSAAVGQV